jgi:hypothetical protein
MGRLCNDGSGRAIMGMKEADVTYIVPVSDEMKGLFGLQEQILNRENGINDEEWAMLKILIY